MLALGALSIAAAALIFGSASPSAAQATAAATAAPTQAVVDPTTTALIRVIHAAPDAPAIDVYIDQAAAPSITNLPFANGTDGYLTIKGGAHRLTITATGDPKTVVYDGTDTYASGTATTVIAEGLLADKSFGLRFTLDDLSPTNGKSRVKVTHAISDGPAIDLATSDFKTTLITNLAYGSSSLIDVAPGSYDLVVVPTGKQTPIVIDLTGTKLVADQIYSVFATGTLTGKVPVKPLLFITSPVPGFTIPVAPAATMAATMVATAAQ